MVYLEQQSLYLKKFKDSPIDPVINEILRESTGDFSDAVHIATNIALNLLITLKLNDKINGEKFYSMLKQRQPTRESHWIYDNFVLFSLTCVVRKFGFEQKWLRSIIDIPYTSADPVNKIIRDTLKNILSGNFNVNGDFHQISVAYQFLSKEEHYNEDTMNLMLSKLWLKDFPFFDDDFLNIISIKALEVVLLKKKSLTDVQYYHLNHFARNYNNRVQMISIYISWFFVGCVMIIASLILWKLINSESEYPLMVKILGFIGSFSGVGISAFWGWNSYLAKIIRKLIDRMFDYNPPKIVSNTISATNSQDQISRS